MRISDWSSDVCSSDFRHLVAEIPGLLHHVVHLSNIANRRLSVARAPLACGPARCAGPFLAWHRGACGNLRQSKAHPSMTAQAVTSPPASSRPAPFGPATSGPATSGRDDPVAIPAAAGITPMLVQDLRSDEPTSALQSLMRISHAVL